MLKIVRIDYGNQIVPDDPIVRALLLMKQRMKAESPGSELTSSIKVETLDKREPNPTVLRSSLPQPLREISNLVKKYDSFLEFQVRSWEYIQSNLTDSTKDVIIEAYTGFGKTEAAMAPLINSLLVNDGLVIAIFPRRSLLLDQVERLSDYDLGNGNLRIGIQMTGIGPKLDWTIYDDFKDIQMGGKAYSKLDPRRHTNYSFKNTFVEVNWLNRDSDSVALREIKCSRCKGTLRQTVGWTNLSDRYSANSRPRGESSYPYVKDTNHNISWKCDSCKHEQTISISKEDHIESKPNVLFTTIDSLASLFTDPDMRKDIKERLMAVVLDEVHVYTSIYGAQTAALLRQLRKYTTNNPLFIGLSATVSNPNEFGRKLFGRDVEVFAPTSKDVNVVSNVEKYYFMRSTSLVNSEGDYYSLRAQNMIQLGIFLASSNVSQDEKLLAFMDSVDAVSMLRRQIEDAYNVKRMQTFRLEDLTNHSAGYLGDLCSGYARGKCHITCPIYSYGECWIINREERQVSTPSSISISSVHAGNISTKEELRNSKFIFSTSELQLGMDLPNITHLLQYGAPYTIFDYIQRKGRAGRTVGSYPYFYFVIGNNATDFIYFAHSTAMLSRSFRLPLNPKNNLVIRLSELTNKIGEHLQELYEGHRTGSSDRIEGYILKFNFAWESLLSEVDTRFSDFIRSKCGIELSAFENISNYTEFRRFKDRTAEAITELIRSMELELNGLYLDGKMPKEYLLTAKRDLFNGIDNVVIDVTENSAVKSRLESIIGAVINDMDTPPRSRDTVRVTENWKILIDAMSGMMKQYLGTELARKAGEFIKIVGRVSSAGISESQEQASQLLYNIHSLWELRKAVNATIPYEIIKYVLRAHYFYMLNYIIDEPLGSIPPFPPLNNFSSTSQEIILLNRRNDMNSEQTVDIRDSLYKYIPFRLTESGKESYKRMVTPAVTSDNGGLSFDTDSILTGYYSDVMGSTFLVPRAIKIEDISDDGVNGIISFCEICFSFHSIRIFRCQTCGDPLTKVRVYSSARMENIINFEDNAEEPLRNLIFSDFSKVTSLLTGVDLTLAIQRYTEDGDYMPTRKKEHYLITASKPYGFTVTTHAIKITVGRDRARELLGYFVKTHPNRPLFNVDNVLHSIAHLWISTISYVSGITPEEFRYSYSNEQECAIVISEIQQGGAGFIQSFLEDLVHNTGEVLIRMKEIINCEENQRTQNDERTKKIYDAIHSLNLGTDLRLSVRDGIVQRIVDSNVLGLSEQEIIDKFPTCYDGCPFCIGLTGCNHGRDGQYDEISLDICGEYLKSLIITTKTEADASEVVARGGILIQKMDGKNDGYKVFFL